MDKLNVLFYEAGALVLLMIFNALISLIALFKAYTVTRINQDTRKLIALGIVLMALMLVYILYVLVTVK